MDMIFNNQFLAISCATSLTSAGEKLTLAGDSIETFSIETFLLEFRFLMLIAKTQAKIFY